MSVAIERSLGDGFRLWWGVHSFGLHKCIATALRSEGVCIHSRLSRRKLIYLAGFAGLCSVYAQTFGNNTYTFFVNLLGLSCLNALGLRLRVLLFGVRFPLGTGPCVHLRKRARRAPGLKPPMAQIVQP